LKPGTAEPAALPSVRQWHSLTRLEATTWAVHDEGWVRAENPEVRERRNPRRHPNHPVRQLLHADSGSSMTSKPVALLMADRA
jgi:hypothetical protein